MNLRNNLYRRIAVIILLAISYSSEAQIQIQDTTGSNISGTTLTICGNNTFDLKSSNTSTQDTLEWTWVTISGQGSLSISDSSGIQPTFTPSLNGVSYYTVTLTQNPNSTNSSSAQISVAVAPNPTFPSIPNQLCENNGSQVITNVLGANQSMSANSGILSTTGTSVELDPTGLNDGTLVIITLTETFTVPNTTVTFNCSSTQSLTVYTAPNVSLNLGTVSFQKCSSLTTLSGGSPSGGTYSIAAYPNAINSSGQLDLVSSQ